MCLAALASVDLADKRQSARLGALSGGMLKRVSIAQALLTAPPVLLCDEPTAGLDPEQRASIRALLRQLAAERCLVVASHIVEDAQYLADRVVVLARPRHRLRRERRRAHGLRGRPRWRADRRL